MATILGYIDRANSARIELTEGRRPVADGFDRAVLRFGAWCLDTADQDAPIQMAAGGKAVDVQVGLVEGLVRGQYTARLTVYDQENPEGLAWPTPIGVFVQPWDACEVVP